MSKTAFLFPGQGSQTIGMGREAAAAVEAAQALFDRAADILGFDLAALCADGPQEKLDATDISQPAIFVASLAALEQIKGTHPDAWEQLGAVAGLSLGEYTALVCAEAMDFETGLRIVRERGLAMQEASEREPSGMVSVLGLELDELEPLCQQARRDDQVLQVANLLCPGNIVVSGTQAACDRLAQMATAAGAMKVIPLSVAGAFHTPLMQPAVERLSAVLAEAPLRAPRIPVVSNVDAQPHDDPDEIRDLLVQQVVRPVQWEASMRWLLAADVDSFFEIGPGRVLRGLLRRINRRAKCESTSA